MTNRAKTATGEGSVRVSWLALTALLVIAFWAMQVPLAFGQAPDDDAIKAVIKAETDAYFKRDAEAWQAAWMHDAKASRTLIGAGGGNSPTVGWDKLSAGMQNEIKESPKPISVELSSDHYLISSDGSMAWVEFDQTLTAPGVFPTSHSREQRTLLKQNSQWKILSQITTNKELFETSPQAIEMSLNMAGYKLLAANKAKEAVEVFKVNAALNPQSWNAYDSLGEAYAKAGSTALAIQSYDKSVKLNPANNSSKMALAKLKQK